MQGIADDCTSMTEECGQVITYKLSKCAKMRFRQVVLASADAFISNRMLFWEYELRVPSHLAEISSQRSHVISLSITGLLSHDR